MQVSAVASAPSPSARADEREAALHRDVAEVGSAAGRQAELERAPDGLGLRHGRPGIGVRHRIDASLRLEHLREAPHDVVVLGVEADERPDLRADLHRQQELAVGHAREAHGVGLERRDLEGRRAGVVQRRDLVETAAGLDRRVQRDVDDGLGLDVRDLLLEARERVDGSGSS